MFINKLIFFFYIHARRAQLMLVITRFMRNSVSSCSVSSQFELNDPFFFAKSLGWLIVHLPVAAAALADFPIQIALLVVVAPEASAVVRQLSALFVPRRSIEKMAKSPSQST